MALDADAPALAELTYLLSNDQRVELVAPAMNMSQAGQLVDEKKIDVVFVCLVHHSTEEINQVLIQQKHQTDFVALARTTEAAVDAFEFGALDYILKPVTSPSIDRALERAIDSKNRRNPYQPIKAKNRIAIDVDGIQHFLEPSDVLFIEAQGDYTAITTTRGHHISRHSLSALAEQLAESGFIRVHRSWLVSSARIDSLSTDCGQTFVTISGHIIPVARRNAREVKQRLL
jgi:DNA-binding LytR/AlgR family response regulator